MIYTKLVGMVVVGLMLCGPVHAAIALVDSVSAASANQNDVTTAAIDTTGASLLVVSISSNLGATAPTLSDNKGNSWTTLTAYSFGASVRVAIAYSSGGTVGSGHTFSLSGGSSFPALSVASYSGTDTSDPYDKVIGDNDLTPGSTTPTNDNALCVTGICPQQNGIGSPALNSGTVIESVLADSSFSNAIGHLIQGSKAAYNPTWSWTGVADGATTTAVFNEAIPEPEEPTDTILRNCVIRNARIG